MNEAERIEKFKIGLKSFIGSASDMPISIIYYVLKEQLEEVEFAYKDYQKMFLEKFLTKPNNESEETQDKFE